jgi:hypothetical protein
MPQNTADGIRQLRRAAAMRLLYPAGHPIHASALEQARESVNVLLGGTERVDLVVAGERLSIGDEQLDDDDGMIGELAGRWWELGLCGLGLAGGLTDAELDLLMAISAPSAGDLGEGEIRRRLTEIGATHLNIVDLDYDRFVPRSQLPRELQEQLRRTDIRETLRELVADSYDENVPLEEGRRQALVALLQYPEALAQAIEAGVLSSGSQAHRAGGSSRR